MGLYNNLFTNFTCSNCNKEGLREIQFKFGFLRLINYRIGDKIIWNDNQDEGRPHLNKVKVAGLPANKCCHCGYEDDECEIIVEKDIIKKVYLLKDEASYIKSNSYFIILEE